MTDSPASSRRSPNVRAATGILQCPACGNSLKVDSKWCPTCNFTGGDSMAMFPQAPPALLPMLDTVGLLNKGDLRKIESARDRVIKRFPQFQWRVCLVDFPADTSLPLYGFWLLNACPLHELETAEQRAWTVLLLVHANHGKVSVSSGYAAESCMSNDEWKSILTDMAKPWSAGNPGAAICQFFKSTRRHLEKNWNRFGKHYTSRYDS